MKVNRLGKSLGYCYYIANFGTGSLTLIKKNKIINGYVGATSTNKKTMLRTTQLQVLSLLGLFVGWT